MPDLADHPFVLAAAARLRNAEREAASVSYPYAPDTRVILVTPARTTIRGVVLTCDYEDDGYLRILAEPGGLDGFRDVDGDVMFFHAHTSPLAIEDGGVLVFETQYRTSLGIYGDLPIYPPHR